jgi:diguanylate cyclase
LFLNDRHFVRWVEVLGSAIEPRAGAAGPTSPAAGGPAHPPPGATALDPGEHDALTGLWNRRRFETELDRARQDAEHLALVSIDVDRYRDVIQRHGPAAAQGLIQAIAHVLAERLRPNDTLARTGGDEFAAVFRHATPALIQSLADGLCTAVREQLHATGTSRIPATISIGAAFFDAGTQTHHEALRAADTALGQAKAAGGNRAIVREPPPDA